MAERPIFTYQARIAPMDDGVVLDAYAELVGRAERTLFAAMRSGGSMNDLKRTFLKKFGLTARQFNAIRIGLEGKMDSIRERRPELIAQANARIRRAQSVMKRLQERAPGSNKLHQKKRRLATLQARLSALQTDHENGIVRLCFGSRKLFRAQFDLASNNYASHEDWKVDWQRSRSRQFFVLGSGDETAGNQSCQAREEDDGSLTLQLRLPDALVGDRKYLTMHGVHFAYGHAQIVAALNSSRRVSSVTKAGRATMKRVGTALSYRFVRDDKGWRVFVSVEAPAVMRSTHRLAGAIGVDLNADHLAVAELDRHGNPIHVRRIDLPLFGKSAEQAKAVIGDVAVALAALARGCGKPVVIEKLDFAKKKAELEEADPARARQLSSFACNKTLSSIKAACFRDGVEVIEINPAYTSVIGAVNHAQRRGISVHQGAAIAIARRAMSLSERPTVHKAITPVRNGDHVTFDLPVRNRSKHVWSFWSKVRTRLKAAHVAHARCGKQRMPPPPLSLARPAKGAICVSTVQVRGANRHQHCSDDVLVDIPF